MHREVKTELAIHDLQKRLILLGYCLGSEAEKGLFGDKTAAAVASFKENNGLGFDDVLDQATWTALRDASMQMGDRDLFLHMPNFRGRDVGELQNALAAMGFACSIDSSFGPETEQALRDFQYDMGLPATGMLNAETASSIYRLRHLWEGKRGFTIEGRRMKIVRSIEVLEHARVCFFGIDEPTRVIANRIANLARATTIESGIVSASSLTTEPDSTMLLIGLELRGKDATRASGRKTQGVLPADTPLVTLKESNTLTSQMSEALKIARTRNNRLTILVDIETHDDEDPALVSQNRARIILDTLCDSLNALE